MTRKVFLRFFLLSVLLEANTLWGNPLGKSPTTTRNPFASRLPPKPVEPSLSVPAEILPAEKKEPFLKNSPIPKPDRAPQKFPKKQTPPNQKTAVRLTGIVIVGQERFALLETEGTHHFVLQGDVFLGKQVVEIQNDRVILFDKNQKHVLKIQTEGED